MDHTLAQWPSRISISGNKEVSLRLTSTDVCVRIALAALSELLQMTTRIRNPPARRQQTDESGGSAVDVQKMLIRSGDRNEKICVLHIRLVSTIVWTAFVASFRCCRSRCFPFCGAIWMCRRRSVIAEASDKDEKPK